MDQKKISAVMDWPVPKTVKDVQRFMGFANFYRRFIPEFSKKISSLAKLTKKTEVFRWSEEQQKSFQELEEFCSAPILKQPDLARVFILEADASDKALGAVLSQRNEAGVLHPVAYHSRKFTPAEKNYTILEKELLAIKDSLQQWRHYLEGALLKTEIWTDHKNLIYLKSMRCHGARHARWSLFFTRFNFSISYRPGTSNLKADALSRIYPSESSQVENPLKMFSDGVVVGQLQAGNKDLLEELENFGGSPDGEALLEDEAFHRDFQGCVRKGHLLVIPEDQREKILRWSHDDILAGHPGVKVTEDLVRKRYWWETIAKDVREYVSNCAVCASRKSVKAKPYGLLQPLEIPSSPWSKISMDFITDLPSSRTKTVIWVVVDYFTKYAHFIALKKLPTADELVNLMILHIVKLHGIPAEIVTDRGPQFTAKVWQQFLTLWQVQGRLSTAYHPHTDGQTERLNQTLEQYLRCYVSDTGKNWSDLLPTAEIAYNSHLHASLGMSPFECLYGHSPRITPDVTMAEPKSTMRTRLQTIAMNQAKAVENLRTSQINFQKQANKHRRVPPDFQEGDWAWLSTKNLRFIKTINKFKPRFVGPFQIGRKISTLVYELKLPASWRIFPKFHVSLLKPARKLRKQVLPTPEPEEDT